MDDVALKIELLFKKQAQLNVCWYLLHISEIIYAEIAMYVLFFIWSSVNFLNIYVTGQSRYTNICLKQFKQLGSFSHNFFLKRKNSLVKYKYISVIINLLYWLKQIKKQVTHWQLLKRKIFHLSWMISLV